MERLWRPRPLMLVDQRVCRPVVSVALEYCCVRAEIKARCRDPERQGGSTEGLGLAWAILKGICTAQVPRNSRCGLQLT